MYYLLTRYYSHQDLAEILLDVEKIHNHHVGKIIGKTYEVKLNTEVGIELFKFTNYDSIQTIAKYLYNRFIKVSIETFVTSNMENKFIILKNTSTVFGSINKIVKIETTEYDYMINICKKIARNQNEIRISA
jgi:hypothetical protein